MATTTSTPENRIKFSGKATSILGIVLVNLFLTVITLGVYSFWGRTRLRKYTIGNMSLGGDAFEYNGKGLELFLGFLKIIPFILAAFGFFIAIQIGHLPEELGLGIAVFVVYVILPIVAIAGLYGAMKYRFSRTTWRGIRGRLTGSSFGFAFEVIGRFFLNILTLGIMVPYNDVQLYRRRARNMHFGSEQAQFNGTHKGLFGVHFLTLILAVFTLGFSRFWYRASLANATLGETTIGNLKIRSWYDGGGMLGHVIVNNLILIFTLGLGIGMVVKNNIEFFVNNMAIDGDLNTTSISQSTEELSSTGEGLDTVLDADVGFF